MADEASCGSILRHAIHGIWAKGKVSSTSLTTRERWSGRQSRPVGRVRVVPIDVPGDADGAVAQVRWHFDAPSVDG
jgi:hypothetical protein